MDRGEMLDAIDSFIGGFGNRETRDAQNALFIAKELFNIDLPLKYKGMGRCGVECLDLYFTLEDVEPNQKNSEAFNAGRKLSRYSPRELMLMALYLWNEGASALTEEEIEEARVLLEKWEITGEKSIKQSAATSG